MAKLKTYSISSQITGNKVNPGRLHGEIMSGNYVNNFGGVTVDDDSLIIIGDSFADESGLDSLINIHDGTPDTDEVDSSLYGSEYHYAEGELQSTTSSTSFATKVNITTSDLPDGNYLIEWTAETANTSTSGRTEIQILVDGTEIALTGYEAEDNSDWQSHSGFKEMNLSGVTSIDMKWRRMSGGSSKLRRARLKIIRVS